MAKTADGKHTKVIKRTSQGGQVKTSTLSKSQKINFKRYRGQGK